MIIAHTRLWVMTVMVVAFTLASLGHAAQKAPLSGQLNVNTAALDELTQLPGIGPKKAEAIILQRQEKPFQRIDELLEVKGVGPKLFEALKNYVKIDGSSDLQAGTATAAEPQS